MAASELHALLHLIAIGGALAPRRRLLEREGSACAALEAGAHAWREAGLERAQCQALSAPFSPDDALLHWLEGGPQRHVLGWNDADYPPLLREIPEPPLALFVAGSVLCALTDDLLWVTVGRGVQGAGAISAAVTAWLADATRPEVRTRAMAMVGGAIGLSFAASLVLAPLLVGWGGLAGLFWTMACLGAVAAVVAGWLVPTAPRLPVMPMRTRDLWTLPRAVLTNGVLLRLNAGVFILHLIQMALFVVMPGLLARLGGLQAAQLWQVYLPVVLASFALMVPVVLRMEKRRAQTRVLQTAVAGLALVCVLFVPMAGLGSGSASFLGLAATLTGFFLAFNLLEALQPSLASQAAPPELKGLALGCYNTAQSLGLFVGGAAGGWLAAHSGANAVFIGAAVLAAAWWVLLQTRARA